MTALVLAVVLAVTTATAIADAPMTAREVRLSPYVAPGDRFMGIRVLGTLWIRSSDRDGLRVHSLSGLGWDEDEGILYALSDRAALHHLRPRIEARRLVDVEWIASYRMTGPAGGALKGSRSDSEGLVVLNGRNRIVGDARLLVSFERHPRIAEYSPQGRWLRGHDVPARFTAPESYASPNRALEAVTWRRDVGVLSGAERPMRDDPFHTVTLFTTTGRTWSYPLADAPGSALVALEALPDRSLLSVERGVGALRLRVIISIRRITSLPDGPDQSLAVQTLAVLDSSKGWRVDNFEGLARHRGNKFFLVSDDNARAYQRTLLTYFEVLDDVPAVDLAEIPDFEADQQSRR